VKTRYAGGKPTRIRKRFDGYALIGFTMELDDFHSAQSGCDLSLSVVTAGSRLDFSRVMSVAIRRFGLVEVRKVEELIDDSEFG
jgi:hypothetical protein